MADHDSAHQRSFRFLVPLTLLTCGVLLVSLGLDTNVLRVWLENLGKWAPLTFILVGIVALSMMVPKTVVSVTAGALFGTALGSLLLLVIAVSGAALNYSIGRWWLNDSIRRRLQGSKAQRGSIWFRAACELASEAGFRFHLLVRMAPIPTTVISYAMGASGSRFGPFLLAAAVAVIPQMLWVHGGTAATLMNDPAATGLHWISIIIAIAAAVAISVFIPRVAIQRVAALRQTSGAIQ